MNLNFYTSNITQKNTYTRLITSYTFNSKSIEVYENNKKVNIVLYSIYLSTKIFNHKISFFNGTNTKPFITEDYRGEF